MAARRGVLFDVDGTLVDTNYLHVVAWSDAFRACGYAVAMCEILPLIGQGSDRLVTSVLGHPDSAVADAHSAMYGPRLYDVQPFDGAAGLLRRVKAEGLQVVLATSAAGNEAALLRKAIGADDVIDAVTTSDDASSSKPAPDIVKAAMKSAGLTPAHAVFVGDSVWDVAAARSSGLDCVCVLTGGIPEADLREAGAVAVYPSVASLLADFECSPLGPLASAANR
jgi:phosphoglycolate phosphatase-like HAD superfamily hydrolase